MGRSSRRSAGPYAAGRNLGAPVTADRRTTRLWDTEPSVVEDPLAASRRIWHEQSGL
ncbi:hypothetical protein AB0D54_17555 [Streptomyces xanthophaeus]|uniref:hypothetical protein n=1 Tax=Streptomyces xanthophaeus TaxID=67385 RepID=UPI00343D2D81